MGSKANCCKLLLLLRGGEKGRKRGRVEEEEVEREEPGGALVVVSASPYSSGLWMGCWLHALVALLVASGTSHEWLGRACMCWV